MLTALRDILMPSGMIHPDQLPSLIQRRTFYRNSPIQVSYPTQYQKVSLKGGDPAAGSPTATLLRLHPSR